MRRGNITRVIVVENEVAAQKAYPAGVETEVTEVESGPMSATDAKKLTQKRMKRDDK